MKKIILSVFLLSLLSVFNSTFADASKSDRVKVVSIEARDSGVHAIYFSGSVPTQNCTHEDRGIVVGTGLMGADMLLKVALSALINQKDVLIKVDGCTLLNPNKSQNTAPKIIKIMIFN